MEAQQFHVAIALGIAAIGAGFDIKSKTVPNTVSLGGIGLGFVLSTISGFQLGGFGGAARGLGISVLGMFLTAFVPLVLFIRNQNEMGGGDVKILAAIGALCGPILGYQALAMTYLFLAFVVLPARIVLKKKLGTLLGNAGNVMANLFRAREARVKLTPIELPAMIMAPSIFVGLAIATIPEWRQWL